MTLLTDGTMDRIVRINMIQASLLLLSLLHRIQIIHGFSSIPNANVLRSFDSSSRMKQRDFSRSVDSLKKQNNYYYYCNHRDQHTHNNHSNRMVLYMAGGMSDPMAARERMRRARLEYEARLLREQEEEARMLDLQDQEPEQEQEQEQEIEHYESENLPIENLDEAGEEESERMDWKKEQSLVEDDGMAAIDLEEQHFTEELVAENVATKNQVELITSNLEEEVSKRKIVAEKKEEVLVRQKLERQAAFAEEERLRTMNEEEKGNVEASVAEKNAVETRQNMMIARLEHEKNLQNVEEKEQAEELCQEDLQQAKISEDESLKNEEIKRQAEIDALEVEKQAVETLQQMLIYRLEQEAILRKNKIAEKEDARKKSKLLADAKEVVENQRSKLESSRLRLQQERDTTEQHNEGTEAPNDTVASVKKKNGKKKSPFFFANVYKANP